MSRLDALGWGLFFSSQLTAQEQSALWPARIVADRGPRLLAQFEDTERIVVVPGRLNNRGETPVVGDFVLTLPGEEPPIVRVLGRRSSLSRGAAGRATFEQVLAANVDLVFVVQGLDSGVKPRRLERTLAAVHASGARPVVVLTKTDQVEDAPRAVREAEAAAAAAPVVGVSSPRGEGLDAVRALLSTGTTGVLVGPSGAGKSTLLNALLGEALQATREVRTTDSRGRHTTTGRVLVTLPWGGMLIDGPGIRELKLWDDSGISETFDEVGRLAGQCRFRDCRHQGEPGCAVAEAIAQGRLAPDRLASMQKLQQEAEDRCRRRAQAPGHDDKRRWRAVRIQARAMQKLRNR